MTIVATLTITLKKYGHAIVTIYFLIILLFSGLLHESHLRIFQTKPCLCEAGFMKQLKLWMLLICFALGFDSSEGKKCCVSKAYAVCWVTPNFWENALTDKKKHCYILFYF